MPNRNQKASKKETVELEKDAMPNRIQKTRKKERVELERVSDPKDAYAKPRLKDKQKGNSRALI